jgi:hypothetical protein
MRFCLYIRFKNEQFGVTEDSTIAGKAGTHQPFSALAYSSGV